jgi:glutaredoxin
MEDITLYSTRCPKCKAVEILLAKKDICYTLIEDTEKVVKVGEEHGIISAPILRVGDEFLDFSKAVKYINTLK